MYTGLTTETLEGFQTKDYILYHVHYFIHRNILIADKIYRSKLGLV